MQERFDTASCLTHSLTGIKSVIRAIVAKRGLRGLWAGVSPTLLRDTPFSAIYWSSYEGCKHLFRQKLDWPSGFLLHFTSGAIGGTAAALSTCPFDVIKTRRQMFLDPRTVKFPVGTFDIAKDLLLHEGWRGMFIGALPRAAKVAPSCAIMISTYELVKQILGISQL